MAVMGLHIWNLYHRGSQNRNSHEAGRRPKRPNNVNKTVPPNQYLVKNGRLLNQSWMSPPSGIFITFFFSFTYIIWNNKTMILWEPVNYSLSIGGKMKLKKCIYKSQLSDLTKWLRTFHRNIHDWIIKWKIKEFFFQLLAACNSLSSMFWTENLK